MSIKLIAASCSPWRYIHKSHARPEFITKGFVGLFTSHRDCKWLERILTCQGFKLIQSCPNIYLPVVKNLVQISTRNTRTVHDVLIWSRKRTIYNVQLCCSTKYSVNYNSGSDHTSQKGMAQSVHLVAFVTRSNGVKFSGSLQYKNVLADWNSV